MKRPDGIEGTSLVETHLPSHTPEGSSNDATSRPTRPALS